MSALKRFWLELHRRSIWPVLGVYIAVGWGSLQFIAFLVDQVGLPTWVTPFALVLLVIGLPVVLLTAFVQHGPATPVAAPIDTTLLPGLENNAQTAVGGASRASLRRSLTWRRSLLAGALAFLGLGATTGGYMGMRALGVGPFGTLLAAGVLSPNDRIVLADFDAPDDQLQAANIITEALRIDMLQSTGFGLVDPAEVNRVLARMQRDSVNRLTTDIAREVAQRGGYKLVLAGEVGRLGSGYVLSASLIVPASGETHVAFRQTAENDEQLVRAVDGLSKKIRTKVGESLRSINASMPLEQVTTSSLEALMLYTTSERILLGLEPANGRNSVRLLREAVALDSTFAMAYRKIGTATLNTGFLQTQALEATRAAFRHRDRLPEIERRLAEGLYYSNVTRDARRALAAYRRVLELDPQQRSAHNNIMIEYRALGQPEAAIASGAAGLSIPNPYLTHFGNLGQAYLEAGRWDEAVEVADSMHARSPRSRFTVDLRRDIFASQFDYTRTDSLDNEVLSWNPVRNFVGSLEAELSLAAVASAQGRLGRARAVLDSIRERAENRRFAQFELLAAALRARQVAEVMGDRVQALELLRDAVASIKFDTLPPLNVQTLPVAAAFAAAGAERESREWLARSDAARPPEAIRQEREYELVLARLLLLQGRAADAVQQLRRIGREYYCETCVAMPLAEAFDAASQPDSAIARYRMFIEAPAPGRNDDQFYLARAHFRLAELLEQKQDRAGARKHYAAFIDLWKNADPELRPRVQAAQQRLAALRGPG